MSAAYVVAPHGFRHTEDAWRVSFVENRSFMAPTCANKEVHENCANNYFSAVYYAEKKRFSNL